MSGWEIIAANYWLDQRSGLIKYFLANLGEIPPQVFSNVCYLTPDELEIVFS